MSDSVKRLLAQIRKIVASGGDRKIKATQIAEAIREHATYRWVGVYDVSPEAVSVVAWSGPGAPAYPTFPTTKGLTGAAIREKKTIVVDDVRKDQRYLTAFGSTLSEMIVPILHPFQGSVIGTIDVESEKANAFSPRDWDCLEECGRTARPLWIRE